MYSRIAHTSLESDVQTASLSVAHNALSTSDEACHAPEENTQPVPYNALAHSGSSIDTHKHTQHVQGYMHMQVHSIKPVLHPSTLACPSSI